MKYIFLSFAFIFITNMNAQKNQETNYYEMMNMPKVIINKKLTAYTISYIEVKNGVKSELKMNNQKSKIFQS
jgi:hypothetical protein